MKLVLEILGSGDDEIVTHRIVEDYPVTLGRGYHNDIILTDPHVGEQHLRIDFDGQAWTLTDLGSVNPTLVNARAYRSATAKLSSGDVLRLGHTTLRVFSPDHPVEAPVRMQKINPAFVMLTRPRNVWLFFALAVAGVTVWTYTSIWSDETRLTLAGSAAITALTIFIWSALWSVAGRLIRRRSFFMAHVALVSLYLALNTFVAWLGKVIGFLSSENMPSTFAGYAMNTGLLTVLIYGSLSLATLMKKKRRIMAALFFAGGLALGVFTVGFIALEKFSPDAPYPYRLMPYLSRYASADSVDEFMARSEKLFQTAQFARKKQ